MSLPYRILAVLALLAGAFASGWVGHVRYRAGVDAREALALSESNREAERLAARNITRVSDALTAERLASDRRAVDAAARLRELAASVPRPAACPDRNDDPRPAAGVLSDRAREDLVELIREAEAVSARLRSHQGLTPSPSEP